MKSPNAQVWNSLQSLPPVAMATGYRIVCINGGQRITHVIHWKIFDEWYYDVTPLSSGHITIETFDEESDALTRINAVKLGQNIIVEESAL